MKTQKILDQLRLLLQNKLSIKNALISKGIKGVTDDFSTYAGFIDILNLQAKEYSKPSFLQINQPILENPNLTISYVSQNGNDNNSGQTWEQSFETIYRALQSQSDLIYIMQGNYSLNETIYIERPVKIYGGFSKDNTSWQKRNPFLYQTYFDARQQPYGIQMFIDAFDNITQQPNVVINGIIISNGKGEGYSAFKTQNNTSYFENCVAMNCQNLNGDYSGGFTLYKSSILKNCLSINCKSINKGGGYYFGSDSILQSCYAICCQSNYGGGYYLIRSSATLGYIKDCSASGCVSFEGAGMYVKQSRNASNNYFIDNFLTINCQSRNQGACVYTDSNKVVFRNLMSFYCKGQMSIIYASNSSFINCSLIKNNVFNQYGNPFCMIVNDENYLINNLCFNNYVKSQIKGFYVEDGTYLTMIKCASDGSSQYYGEDFITIYEEQIYNDYVEKIWYKPLGYNVINQTKNNIFGDFKPTSSSLINNGYQMQLVPNFDINNNERDVQITIGAYQ